ncbi:LuxR C-terminal-related transcriptional regulator [Nocardia sp. NPDC049149]|uniref:LuxR C-terminal-related transcriptional regulator n=1 Tax=Nocardia sp. NPDC049149 TaxID=3364315 RepID=UPI0037127B14
MNGEVDVDQRLRWSSTSLVGAEGRHRSVGDSIAWSYELCSERERLLFERLSVFAPSGIGPAEHATSDDSVGVSLAAIEAVCADLPYGGSATDTSARLSRNDIGDLLARLVDKALVHVHISENQARYGLLECTQVFAMQRLRNRPAWEAGDQLRRHLSYYHDKVTDLAADWFGPREVELADWIPSIWPNVLIAMHTSFRTPADSALGLEICVALQALPAARMPSLGKTQRWIEHAMSGTRLLVAPPTKWQLHAAALLAWNALCQGHNDEAERLLEQLVGACDLTPGDRLQWRATPRTDIGLPAAVDFAWGYELWMVDQDAAAIAVLTRARDKFQCDGHRGFAARCDLAATAAAIQLDATGRGADLLQQFRARAVAAKSRWGIAWADLLGAVYLIEDDRAMVLARIKRWAAYLTAVGDQWGVTMMATLRMWVLARTVMMRTDADPLRGADSAEIAWLTGALDTLRVNVGIDVCSPADCTEQTEAALLLAQEVLGHEAFESARDGGALLPLERHGLERMAMEMGDADSRPGQPRTHRASGDPRWYRLSEAEQQVALLAAAGWTNKAIAARRGTSAGTVRAQMAAVRSKLAVSSRRDIVRFIPEADRLDVRREAARRLRTRAGAHPSSSEARAVEKPHHTRFQQSFVAPRT